MLSGDNAPLQCSIPWPHPEHGIAWHRYTELNPDGTVADQVDQGILLGTVDSAGNIAHCDKCLFANDSHWPNTMYLIGADDSDIGVYGCSLVNSDSRFRGSQSIGYLSVIRECLY